LDKDLSLIQSSDDGEYSPKVGNNMITQKIELNNKKLAINEK